MKRSGKEGRWADIPSARIRFAFEAAFLVLVAAGAAIARLSPAAIVILMLVAWLLVALIERASSREQTRSIALEDTPPIAAAVEDSGRPAEIRAPEGYRWLFWRRRVEAAQPLPAPTEALEERPSRAHVRRIEPEAPVVAEPPVEIEIEITEIVVTEALPGPAATKRPLDLPGLEEPEPARALAPPSEEAPAAPPVTVKAPPPAPPPPVPQPPPPRPPAREWNLWDLERRAREQAGDAARDEEWSALFVHLREYANADGVLPKEFDDLVRESFAELIQAA